MNDQIKEISQVLTRLEKKRDEESGSVLQKLEHNLSEKQKVEALAQSAVDNKKEGLKAEQKKRKDLVKQSDNVRINLVSGINGLRNELLLTSVLR